MSPLFCVNPLEPRNNNASVDYYLISLVSGKSGISGNSCLFSSRRALFNEHAILDLNDSLFIKTKAKIINQRRKKVS